MINETLRNDSDSLKVIKEKNKSVERQVIKNSGKNNLIFEPLFTTTINEVARDLGTNFTW